MSDSSEPARSTTSSRRALERERDGAVRKRKLLEDALTAARKAAEEASLGLTRARADAPGAAELAQTSQTLYETLRQQFSEKAQAAGFADHAAFRAAKLDDKQIRAIDAEIREYHVALLSAKERLDRATAAARAAANREAGQSERGMRS